MNFIELRWYRATIASLDIKGAFIFFGDHMKQLSKLPIIQLESVYIRAISKKDASDFYDLGKDELTTEFLTWGPFKRLKDAHAMIKYTYLKRIGRKEPVGYAIIDKNNDKMIGTIEFHSFNYKQNTCEIGYVLHRAYWNKGIMTACLIEVTKIAFQYLDLDKVIIKHIKENQASQKVILKAGYKQTAYMKNSFFHPKTERFHDVYVYEKLRRIT